MSRSPTTPDADRLPNDDAGALLVSEFLVPLGMDAAQLARATGAAQQRIQAMIDGDQPVDGELDLRFTRYFGLSEGFFLRLQNSYALIEAKRALNGALDRIVPRVA